MCVPSVRASPLPVSSPLAAPDEVAPCFIPTKPVNAGANFEQQCIVAVQEEPCSERPYYSFSVFRKSSLNPDSIHKVYYRIL